MGSIRRPTSARLSTEALRLMDKLASKLGISRTAVLELAIREYARLQGVDGGEGEGNGNEG